MQNTEVTHITPKEIKRLTKRKERDLVSLNYFDFLIQ